MPLPKNYYDLFGEDTTFKSPVDEEYPGLYPSITRGKQVEGDGNALWDFLGSGLGGFTSGMTWGVADLAGVTGQETWEEMSGAEKAGWILGEGASFFTPFGPFSLLGKSSKAIAQLGNKFVGRAAQEAAETFVPLTVKQARSVAKATKKGVDFSDEITQGLNKVAKDNLGVRWIKDLNTTGEAALRASDNLVHSGTNAVLKAFKDAGIKGVAEADAKIIAKEFTKGLQKGNYVNDVAEWVARGLAGEVPGRVRGFMSKYLGMVAQDMFMIGTHSLVSGKIKALANGEDFDATGSLKHAVLMSLGFPLIRLLPGGGVANLSTGTKAYWNSFKGTSYRAIQATHGDEVVKNLLKVMTRGSKKELLSRSELYDASFKAGGKLYKNGAEIEAALPTMKVDDAITLLEKMNKHVNKALIKKWGPDFLEDLGRSIPRMGAGVVAMNPWVFDKDAWGSMEGPELASHLFMSAVMTKGRGAWVHGQQRRYFSDFTPYHEALQVLGVDAQNVNNILRFHGGKNAYEGMGLALGTHEVGVKLTKTIDEALLESQPRPTASDYSNPDHAIVKDLGNLYNVIKKHGDDRFVPIKFENLDAKTLNLLASQLKAIEFEGGQTIKELGYEGALVKLTLEPAARGIELYKRMMASLGSELGYDLALTEDGRLTGSHIISENKSIDDASTVNRILTALNGVDVNTTVKTGRAGDDATVNYEQTVQRWIKKQAAEGRRGLTENDFNIRTREIIDEHMDQLGREYGDKNIYRDPVNENPMFDFFKQAKGIEASERVMNIVTGKFPGKDVYKDRNLTDALDQLFQLSDGKYASSIDTYKDLVKDYIKDPKTDKEKEANEKLMLNLNDLRALFELRKRSLGGTSRANIKERPTISAEGISIAHQKWNDIYKSLPTMWKQDWEGHTLSLYTQRMFKGKGFDRRAVNLLSFMSDHNLILTSEDGTINMPSKKAVLDELKNRGGISKKDLAEYDRALSTIRQVLGGDVVREIDYSFTESGKRQLEEVDMSQFVRAAKLLGNQVFSDLLTETQTSLDRLTAKNEGTRQTIHQLHNKITDLMDTLDPANDKAPVKDPIKNINSLVKELKALRVTARSEETKGNVDEAMAHLSVLIDHIDRRTKKFIITPERTLTETEQLSDDPYGIDVLTRPLQTSLTKIFSREYEGIDKLQELVVKLENLSSRGKAGLGLEQADVMRIVEDLSREWYATYKGETDKGVKVLSEVIEQVNKNGFFGDAVNLLEGVNTRINKEIILKNEHHPFNEDGVRMSEALEKGYKTNEHHRTPVEILKDYGLVDVDGKIKQSFRDAVSKNPVRALSENIREQIYAQENKSDSQKAGEWKKFRENDAQELLTTIDNSRPINRVKLMAVTRDGRKRGILEFNNNAPHIRHPNTDYFQDKGYKVHWLDDTMSVDVGGKLRNVSISSFESPDQIQKYLNEALRTDKITQDILDGFKEIDKGLSERDIMKILKNPSEYMFYLRLSPMDKMMFVGTKKNLKIMDTEFEAWYNNALKRYSGKDKDIFEQIFSHLKDASNSSRHMVELKMLLPYLEHTGRRSAIDEMIKEYAGDARPEVLAKIQANMFKRGFLFDGGTTQPMSKLALNWVKSHHPNADRKAEAKRILDQDGFISGLLSDRISEDNINHPLNIANVELGQLKIIGDNASGLIRELAQVQGRSVENMPSLMASLLDGGKFASERVMKLIMSNKGMLDTDFTDSPNGAKTIIFAVGNNQMGGKGYMIYHPEIAKNMPKDVDILIGDSSAKTFDGVSLSGKKLEAFDLEKAGPKWNSSLKKMGNNNKMLLPIESIGVSFTSKTESGVAISPSIFDWQSPAAIKDAVLWMGFEAKLQQIGVQWNSVHRDGAKLAEWLYEIGQSEGNPLDKGDTGLSKLLFTYGAMPGNPLVQRALKRLLRSSNYKHLGKVSNQEGGEDNFIVPNINGDLSVPLYAELYNAANVQVERASVIYGGIGLNSHTARRRLGNGVGANLEGEKFIFRDGNGVDVVIGIENGKPEYYSTFYDKATEGMRYRGTDNQGNDKYSDVTIKMDAKSKAAAKKQLQALMKLVKNNELNLHEAFRLLNGETVSKDNRKTGISSSFKLPIDANLKMQFGVGAHSIPTVGHDKVVFRVEKIMDNMQGLTEVNVHDLRTVLQRDNDGDHLFTHTKLPWSIFKQFASENGRKDDFRMFDRSKVLTPEYINIFGIGKPGGKAGDNPQQVGFQNYASKLHQAQMMIGQVIGSRNAMSWLNRLGFKVGEDVLLKDMIDYKGGMSSDSWKALDKFYDTVQNALDIHSGIHEVISSQQKLKDFLYFGLQDKYLEPTGDPAFDKHSVPGLGMFNIEGFGKTRIQKEVFYEILRTLKKSSMIMNDTWDERGSRSPEPFEIKQAYYDMRGLFANPTGYLAKQLGKKISLMRNKDEKDALISEYAEMFYKGQYDLKREDGKKKLYLDILQGKTASIMKKIFSFDPRQVPSENPEAAFDMSIGGHVMKGLLKQNAFWDPNYEGLAERGTDIFNKAGFFVKNIESFVETARMLGDDPVEAAIASKESININSFDPGARVSGEIRNALNNGILRELIQRQHRNVMGTLEYFRGERFVNPSKMEKLQDRLANLQAAVDIMDNQIAKNMVIDRPDVQILSPLKPKKQDFKWVKEGRNVAVYRVRGDVEVMKGEEKESVYNYGIDNERLNYGQLEYVGRFDSKSKPLRMLTGYSYIIDKNPKDRISQSNNEAKYSRALFKATYGDEISPETFMRDNISDFRDATRQLRASISMDYIKTVGDALSNRVLSDGMFALTKAKEGREIAEYIERWSASVDNPEPVNTLLRYLLQPQLTRSSYYKDALGHEMPAYKTNEHLYKTVMQWAENNPKIVPKDFVRNLVHDVEHYASGKDTEIDISSYSRGSMDRFDYTELGKMANSVRSLAKHLDIFFASPILDAKISKMLPRGRGKVEQVRGKDGQLIPVRRTKGEEYWRIRAGMDQEGEGC